MQKTLASDQVREFYHDNFVADQVRDFLELVGPAPRANALVVDVGGGCGFFAHALEGRSTWHVRVLDTDPESVRTCNAHGVEARLSDALQPQLDGDEAVVCFNLILHHLVAGDAGRTRAMQLRALRAWAARAERLFVNEYIYESYIVPPLSARLIFAITSSSLLSMIGRTVAHYAPSLRANTFGVGVRFRGAAEWATLFYEAGFEVVAHRRGREEPVSTARRLLLIRSCRRDSFLLRTRII